MGSPFETSQINGMKIRNRIIRSATWEGSCTPDGCPTEKTVSYYRDLAAGQVGLIISGYTFVSPEGKQQPGKGGVHTDDFAAAYQQITEAVHGEGGSVVMQLVHAGGQAMVNHSGLPAVAPSSVELPQFPQLPAELSVDAIGAIVRAFGAGARRAKAWGYDGVQLHGAHGYLINQFLSPLTNRRTDAYGGSLDNRSRFLREVITGVRREVGEDFPVMIKLNASDHLDGGLTFDDVRQVVQMLDGMGIDAIEVSSGTSASGERTPARSKITTPDQEGYNLDFARQIKQLVRCPVIAVGGFRTLERVESALGEDGVDYVAMSRPFIWEPNLVARWAAGEQDGAQCISCNRCFIPGQKGGIYCMEQKKRQRRASQ